MNSTAAQPIATKLSCSDVSPARPASRMVMTPDMIQANHVNA